MKTRPELRAIHQKFILKMQKETTVPGDPRTRSYKTDFTHPAHGQLGPIIAHIETTRRQPGILDNLLNAKSHDDASSIWKSFIALAPKESNKTINRAVKIFNAHMEGRVL